MAFSTTAGSTSTEGGVHRSGHGPAATTATGTRPSTTPRAPRTSSRRGVVREAGRRAGRPRLRGSGVAGRLSKRAGDAAGPEKGRGIHHRTAANGTNTGNQNYYAICGLVDAPDTPSPDLIQGIKDGVAYLLEKGDAASKILGHRDIHSTDCPGDKLYHLVQNGTFKSGGNTGNAYPGSPIRVGASGGIVKKIQERLIALGFKLPKYGADGSFGQETEKAVEAFQEKNNLTKDGIVGSQTWGKLF